MQRHSAGGLVLLVAVSCRSDDLEPVAFRDMGMVVESFEGGVVADNHPEGAGNYGVWYDATNDTFGTPSAASLEGAPAMRIDDGGFTNGVYAIFSGAIPASGTYVVRAPIHVVEDTATTFDAIDAYQIGVAVGGDAIHRGPNPSDLAPLFSVGDHPGLSDGDDTALGPQMVETAVFQAQAGDDLLVALGTDVSSGDWSQASAAWSGAHVLVGAIELVPMEAPDPGLLVDNDDGPPAYAEAGAWSVGGALGYAGGTYRFSAVGSPATATWSLTAPAGTYELETIYRAGANRASAAQYSVTVDGVPTISTTVDQRFQDLSWVELGVLELAAEAEVVVTLDAGTSTPEQTVVIADAIRMVEFEIPPVDPPELRLAAITVFDPVDDVGAIAVLVDQLADLHYNAVAIHTRYRGDATYFPNRFDATYPNAEPRSPQAGDVDVLEEFTTRAHDAGMQVYAYVNTHLVTDGADAVAPPAHVVNTHPDWRTWAYNGGVPTVQTTLEDGEGLWLEPSLPAVREYLADIVGDIALNYAIDGVILDRIRYPQTSFTRENADFGYHPDAIDAFNEEYDEQGIPDPYDPNWIEFRQIAITDTVDAIYDRLREIDEQLVLLAYPIGRFDDAIDFNYQNWPQWLRGRHIDGVLPQIYTSDNLLFTDRLAQHAMAYGGDRLLGVTLNSFFAGIDVAGQIELARAAGFDGSSPFRHGTMGPLGYLDDLELAWDGVAEPPAMPWKGASIDPLGLTAVCSVEPDVQRRWQVDNPNAWAIEVTYWRLGAWQHDTVFAPSGESFVLTDTGPGWNIAVMIWFDEQDHLQWTAQLSWGEACP